MRIGELSQSTATPVETIRFYERQALMPQPARTSGNYRIYGPAHVERLAFIRHCRTLDMTLDEIRLLLRFRDSPHEDCGEVNRLLDRHIDEVSRRIEQLRRLQAQLKELRRQCHEAREAENCGILRKLSAHAADRKRARSLAGS